ncbi:outer membrane protein assembly factor BamB family protein [Actinokineospora fastidiosa]|uniref:Methanol dehydrogenase n=1 Tax=Actinokineospora fastidiosa TaxID=1816 RepID=A0A918GRX6_9PSEU|nr:PQQ-binding-like beta-propeller repeat protein [Actinokineospora fastidiosa]GGS57954.1 methanol dehydrogenase [Actinokineospora fastidiosa]
MRLSRNRGGRSAGRLSFSILTVAGLLVLGGYYGAAPESSAAQKHRTASDCVTWQWSQPNADKSNTRRILSPINSYNVTSLEVAWTVPIRVPAPPNRWPGVYATTPVVVNGIVYTQDLDSNVYAIELRTGRVLWVKMYNSTINGPNGVNVVDGKVYGATTSNAFALDARTGTELWSRSLIRTETEGINMAPGVDRGTVYVSTGPGNADAFFTGGGAGVLWALDARTGQTKWTFNSVPLDLWGNTELNSGGGIWYPPAFDASGDLYVSVGNPAPFLGTEQYPWGSSRPGPNLYTNSMVKLNHLTGDVIWHNQVLPHDLYDWDLQNSPVLTTANGREVVIGSGKMGYVYQFDRATGQLLWKTSVGVHNGHDNDNLYALNGEYDKLPTLPVTVTPGVLGGVISPLAVDDTTIYAAVNNHSATWVTQQPPPQIAPFNEATGELVAIDLVTGRIKWTRQYPSSAYGAATVTNDLVFTTTFDGYVHAVRTRTGEEVWSVKLPAAVNAPVAVHGEYLLAASGWPFTPEERAEIVAYRLPSTRGGSQ